MKRLSLVSFAFLIIALFFFPAISLAFNSTLSLRFEPKDLSFEKTGDYDRVKLAGALLFTEPGKPLLPVKYVQIAIPADVEVERVEVISFQRQELVGGYDIYPAQPFLPLSDLPTKGEDIRLTPPDPSVYNSSFEYPGELARVTNNGFLGGQHLAGVALYPLQYIPAERKLFLYTQIEFKLIFRPASHFPAPVYKRSARGADFYSSLVKSTVINPEEVKVEAKGILSEEDEVDYLIITGSSFVSVFQPLADWKIRKGISTEIKDVSWVFSNYPGYDNPEKIRNCIRDYYANHGTKWVLLGGDTPILPHRMAPVMGEDIPCDYYFSDLDSNWDADGDHFYGEYEDSVDLYPDVFVGRAPSNNLTQAQTFVNKCLTYETNPPTDYQNRILYAAEWLWSGTDAAECKNFIDTSFVPGYFQDTKLYESSGNLTWANFRDGLNQGQNIINHNGHGNTNIISIGSDTWVNQDMDNLVNGPRNSLFYTFACITAAIDNDCLGEHFINNPHGGGMAYCGNTRYGWGIVGDPLGGPGPELDIEFFRVLFDSSIYQVGKTLGNSKIPFVPVSSDPVGLGEVYRWTLFTLLLLGDPTLELWTNTPGQLSVTHAPNCYVGMNYFEVDVAQNNALVCCVMDGEILGRAYSSGGSAMVYFDSPLFTMGAMLVTVTHHDYLPYQDTVMVIPTQGPCIIYYSHQIDDTPGNSNWAINPGETIWMPIEVKNIGLEDAHNVSATLREEDSYIVIPDSVKGFGNIDSGMTDYSSGHYIFCVDPACPDSHVVKFTLQVTSSEGSWSSSFLEMVTEPDFSFTSNLDTVYVRQGDSARIKLYLNSLGGFDQQVTLTHSALPPQVSGVFNPIQLIPTDSSVFKIFPSMLSVPGIYPLTITATGAGVTHYREVMLGIMPPPYYGPVWHVSTTGHDVIGNGSETYPLRTIQKGIESADPQDTVLAEKGRYVENIDFLGKAILVGSRYIYDHQESTIDSTIIDGDSSGIVVTFWWYEGPNSIIRGFTLTHGYSPYGGGISCDGSSPTIADNILVGNVCPVSSRGSAIFCGYSSNAKIYRNLIYHSDGAPAIAFYAYCGGEVINNTVCNNALGGLSIRLDSYIYVKNNIFCDNATYGIHTELVSEAGILYNDVYGQENNYGGDLTDQTGLHGNISSDPLFAGGYHLAWGSPCIDAGDPADSVPLGAGSQIDMGAFEYWHEGPWVFYHSHLIDDSAGNNNGGINPGEIIAMPFTLKNNGFQTAYGVSGKLRTDDEFIAVMDSLKNFGDIGAGMTGMSQGNYRFEVDSSCPSLHPVEFTLVMTDGDSTWTSRFTEIVSDSDFALTADPESVQVESGKYTDFQLIGTSLGGFGSEVNLSHSQFPSGVSGQFLPDHLIPTDTSIFRISATSEAVSGVYSITVTATGGGITHEMELTFNVLIRGDCNRNGVVDVGDVIYLINYAYKDGPLPVPKASGDVNCDGLLNIGDIIYLLNYLYRGGPAPTC